MKFKGDPDNPPDMFKTLGEIYDEQKPTLEKFKINKEEEKVEWK